MAFTESASPRRRLRVDLAALQAAFDDVSFETHYFLDREAGCVVLITGGVRRELEQIYESLNSSGARDWGGFEAAVRRLALPGPRHDALVQAHRVEQRLGSRYVSLPPAHPHIHLRDMEDFISTVADHALFERLIRALRNSDPPTHFRAVLQDDPAEAERWRAFQQARVRERVRHWLEEEGIEPIE